MSQVVSSRLLPGFNSRLVHVRFVVNKVAIGQDFSEYFVFPCLHIHVDLIRITNGKNLETLQKRQVPPPRDFGKN